MAPAKTGSCPCGAVSFVVKSELKAPDACHCVQCRKQSGHYFASTDVPRAAIEIIGQENVTWYRSSVKVRRGFCSVCGSSLFFDPPAREWIGVAMGRLRHANSHPSGDARFRCGERRLLPDLGRSAAEPTVKPRQTGLVS